MLVRVVCVSMLVVNFITTFELHSMFLHLHVNSPFTIHFVAKCECVRAACGMYDTAGYYMRGHAPVTSF